MQHIPAEQTPAQIPFCYHDNHTNLENAKIIFMGVPYDDTPTFGHGCDRGPEGMREISSIQLGTYESESKTNLNIYKMHDMGDFLPESTLTQKEKDALYDSTNPINQKAKQKVESAMRDFAQITKTIANISTDNKLPIIFGGEHTISYFTIKGLSDKNPVIIHFDAHRDMKSEFLGVQMCHTTPFYHLIKEHPNLEIIQIGIRATDEEEETFVKKHSKNITTFNGWNIEKELSQILKIITSKTKNRNVYISFDIDALDSSFTPCTGTPETFGMTTAQIKDCISAINSSAKLVGADIVEVAVKNDDFREANIATQILHRLLTHDCVSKFYK